MDDPEVTFVNHGSHHRTRARSPCCQWGGGYLASWTIARLRRWGGSDGVLDETHGVYAVEMKGKRPRVGPWKSVAAPAD